jgi:hypothetical protein
MKNLKHTPGPWNGISYNAEDLSFDTVRIKNDKCDVVCITNHANAALIAAAPEMLEALATIYGLANLQPLLETKYSKALVSDIMQMMQKTLEKAKNDFKIDYVIQQGK